MRERVSRRELRWPTLGLFAAGVGLATGACAAPRARPVVDHAALSEVRDVRVIAGGPEDLGVVMRSDRRTEIPFFVFASIASIEVGRGAKEAADRRDADRLAGALADFSFVAEVETHLARYLSRSSVFERVSAGPAEDRTGPSEAEVRVVIEHFGLRPALRRDAGEDRLQVGCEVSARITPAGSTRPCWEWNETYLHGTERSLAEIEAQPEWLRAALRSTAEEIAIRISNAIRVARRGTTP